MKLINLFFYLILIKKYYFYKLGNFIVDYNKLNNSIKINNERDNNKILFYAENNFIKVGLTKNINKKNLIINGNYNYKYHFKNNLITSYQTINNIFYNNTDLIMKGILVNNFLDIQIDYEIHFYYIKTDLNQLKFNIKINKLFTYIYLTYWCEIDENFYGFGTQFTHWNLKGKRVPIIVSEQGIGRGKQPISFIVNMCEKYSSGNDMTTYGPKSLYITNYLRSIIFENNEITYFDLKKNNSLTVELFTNFVRGIIIYENSLLNIIKEITKITGRMKPLPEWTQKGAIIGLEGGTNQVKNIINNLLYYNIKISGVWLQDWVNLQKTLEGVRLSWYWKLKENHYPNWNNTKNIWLKNYNIRILTYINPYFSVFKNNLLLQEGIKNSYFIKNNKNKAYYIYSGSIKFHLLDLTNPNARIWMKNIIKNNMIKETGVSGWMSDFGEHLPTDAILYNNQSALDFHNIYPEEWAKLNSEVLNEYNNKDIIFFMRSSSLKSIKYTPLYWLGDQLVTWDNFDGLKTVLNGFLSSGISGHSLTHSDIGGYTQVPFMYLRSKELLLRWIEISTFGSAIFRTHIGSLLSKRNAQVFNDINTIMHFKKFIDIFVKLKKYRNKLMLDAYNYGWPLMRPLAVLNNNYWNIRNQYMFGNDFMICPIMNSKQYYTNVFMPKNIIWVHLWSSLIINGDDNYIKIRSFIGEPPVFYIINSTEGIKLNKHIKKYFN